MIHDGMLYDPIQCQGHGCLKVANMASFKICLLHWYACNHKTNDDYDTAR